MHTHTPWSLTGGRCPRGRAPLSRIIRKSGSTPTLGQPIGVRTHKAGSVPPSSGAGAPSANTR
jgi:hypothetical protein